MSDHTSFCEWARRNRASMTRETWEAGDRTARWLFLLESGEASPESRQYAADALTEFRELCGR